MIVCPHCSNSDQTLMEPRIIFSYTMWLCLVCSKTWKERNGEVSVGRA